MIDQDISIRKDWRTAVDSQGRILAGNAFRILLEDEGLLRCTVTTDGATAYALPDVVRFGVRAVIPNTSGPGQVLSDLLIYSAGAENLNVDGDWGDADLDAGKFSMRYNANTQALIDLMSACGGLGLDAVCEIEVENAAGQPFTLAQWPAVILPDVIRSYPDAGAAISQFVLADTLTARLKSAASILADVDWSTAGNVDIVLPSDLYALPNFMVYTDGDVSGLAYTIGTPDDADAYYDAGGVFSTEKHLVLGRVITGGTLRIAITNPGAAGSGGKIVLFGASLS